METEGAAHAGDDSAVAPPLLITNEFADVWARRVVTRNGVRLELTSPRTGTSVRLDAVELEALTCQPPETFSALVRRRTDGAPGDER